MSNQTTEEPIEVLPGGGSLNLSCGRKATPEQVAEYFVAEYFKDRFAIFVTDSDVSAGS